MRVGIGSDIHRLEEGRKLVIGGITIPYGKGEKAHSDGDVLIHAIIDAILGAYSMDDIGKHFPDNAAETEGMNSEEMLKAVLIMTQCKIVNIDTTVNLEKPRLRPYIQNIRENLSRIMEIPLDRISVKAKTAEGLGPVGEGLAISAEAAVLVSE